MKALIAFFLLGATALGQAVLITEFNEVRGTYPTPYVHLYCEITCRIPQGHQLVYTATRDAETTGLLSEPLVDVQLITTVEGFDYYRLTFTRAPLMEVTTFGLHVEDEDYANDLGDDDEVECDP